MRRRAKDKLIDRPVVPGRHLDPAYRDLQLDANTVRRCCADVCAYVETLTPDRDFRVQIVEEQARGAGNSVAKQKSKQRKPRNNVASPKHDGKRPSGLSRCFLLAYR